MQKSPYDSWDYLLATKQGLVRLFDQLTRVKLGNLVFPGYMMLDVETYENSN